MRIVVFGLTVSSSWGNGHATLWRGLCRALLRRGHRIVFYERDVPYYADHRDLHELPNGGRIRLYGDWSEVAEAAARDLDDADAAIVTSYCPDGVAASGLVLASRAFRRVFYDLDTPVTLARLSAGQAVEYIGPPYSTDIASAWLVVEKMHERGFDATVRTSGDGVYCEFVHYVRYPTEGGSARIDPREGTAALGICLAALAALSALASPTEEVPEGGEGDA